MWSEETRHHCRMSIDIGSDQMEKNRRENIPKGDQRVPMKLLRHDQGSGDIPKRVQLILVLPRNTKDRCIY